MRKSAAARNHIDRQHNERARDHREFRFVSGKKLLQERNGSDMGTVPAMSELVSVPFKAVRPTASSQAERYR